MRESTGVCLDLRNHLSTCDDINFIDMSVIIQTHSQRGPRGPSPLLFQQKKPENGQLQARNYLFYPLGKKSTFTNLAPSSSGSCNSTLRQQ